MTVSPVGPGAEVAVPTDMGAMGLDDMTQADLSIPRLQIINKKGLFKESLTNTEQPSLNVIILGLVKQRTLWPTKIGDTPAKPMCRSNDFNHGFPNVDQPMHPFPWQASGLTQEHVVPTSDNTLMFNCSDCKLKEWGSRPDSEAPWCNEVWSLALLIDPYQTGQYLPSILSLSKTNLAPARRYLAGFKAAGQAAFTAVTNISLQLLKKGDNDYSNIIFQRVQPTDSGHWNEWGEAYIEMREFLTRAPMKFEEEVTAAPAPVAAPVAAPVVQQAAPQVIEAEVVQNDPWAGQTFPAQQPGAAPASVAQDTSIQAAPVAQAAPVTAPVATPAPVAQAAPVAPPTAPPAPPVATPVSAPAPTPAPVAQPTPTPAPQAVAPAPTPAPSQAAPAPVPTVPAQVPTSPAVPATSVPAVPGDDNDELPF